MTLYTIYDTATGAILRTGCCPEADAGYQAGADEGLLTGHRGDSATQKVIVVGGEASLAPI